MKTEDQIIQEFAEELSGKMSLGEISQYIQFLEQNRPDSLALKIAKCCEALRRIK